MLTRLPAPGPLQWIEQPLPSQPSVEMTMPSNTLRTLMDAIVELERLRDKAKARPLVRQYPQYAAYIGIKLDTAETWIVAMRDALERLGKARA